MWPQRSDRCNEIHQRPAPPWRPPRRGEAHEGPRYQQSRIRGRRGEGRTDHPAVDTSSPPPEDTAGRVGESRLTDTRDRHTSHKPGSRSIAQKEAESLYPDRSTPPSRQVGGASGREPQKKPVRPVGPKPNGSLGPRRTVTGSRRARRHRSPCFTRFDPDMLPDHGFFQT